MKELQIDPLRKFGRLTLAFPIGRQAGKIKWACYCGCGNTTTSTIGNLVHGNVKSCGCLQREFISALGKRTGEQHGNFRHGHEVGHRQSPTYRAWSNMLRRCNDPKIKNYSAYGGRGISVCSRWSDFKNFLEDVGERPKGKTLDRIDVNGNYEPGNCRWATRAEQDANRRKMGTLSSFTIEELLAELALRNWKMVN